MLKVGDQGTCKNVCINFPPIPILTSFYSHKFDKSIVTVKRRFLGDKRPNKDILCIEEPLNICIIFLPIPKPIFFNHSKVNVERKHEVLSFENTQMIPNNICH